MAEHWIYVVIALGVLHVWRDMIYKVIHCTFTAKTDMPVEMMLVAILRVICTPYC